MIILSIDSGLEKTGFSIFKKNAINFEYVVSGLIKTEKTNKYENRLYKIYSRLNDLVKKYKPEEIILERLFFFKNQKTVISISHAQGVVLLLAAQNGIEVKFLTPLQIKLTVTGYGQSDKISVRKMVEMTVKLNKKIKEDDEIDAIACGLAYCYLNRT